MRRLALTISTPFDVLVEASPIRSLRAEDASGSFGILPGHVDFLTALPVSVVRWMTEAGEAGFCAVRGGIMTVSQGSEVAIACRQGKLGTALDTLAADVAAFVEEERDAARRASTAQMRVHARAVRQLMHYLNPQGETGGAFDSREGAP